MSEEILRLPSVENSPYYREQITGVLRRGPGSRPASKILIKPGFRMAAILSDLVAKNDFAEAPAQLVVS